MSRLVMLPWPDWRDACPAGAAALAAEGVDVSVFSGHADGPAPPVDAVTLYVPPYMGAVEDIALCARMPQLTDVVTLTAGTDHVWSYVHEGVRVHNAAGVHDASTAELAVALMLTRLRGLDDAARTMPHGAWEPRTRRALADSRVLVIGAGGVGRAIADRLSPFEVTVTLVGRTARGAVRGVAELPDLLPHADVVVLAVPLTAETEGVVDAEFLARMPAGALLVNVARGPVVDTAALLDAVHDGRITAALDVTDPEPLPSDHPLWREPGVLISPHVGGNTTAFLPRARRMLDAQLQRYARREPLAHRVQPPGADH